MSDLHAAHPTNRDLVASFPPQPDDWLAVAGDVAESLDVVARTLEVLAGKFAQVIWVPGNHELWKVGKGAPAGVARYERLVELCRGIGVLTPEDPFPVWDDGTSRAVVAPVFLLYDYTFRAAGLTVDEAIARAKASGSMSTDEWLLDPSPHPTVAAWAAELVATAEARLAAAAADAPVVLVSHYPLRRDMVRIPRLPDFAPWCGTAATEGWPSRFDIRVAVSGHLHNPSTTWRDGVRYEEVSVGQPREWSRRSRPPAPRVVLPPLPPPPEPA